MDTLGPTKGVKIMQVSTFSSVPINRFHCIYRSAGDHAVILYNLIIYVLYSRGCRFTPQDKFSTIYVYVAMCTFALQYINHYHYWHMS